MLYFAYGMNTNLTQMSVRCPQARSHGGATLMNHKFRFARHADVCEVLGHTVQGVLWNITDKCLRSLDALEGYPNYYERKQVKVKLNRTGEVVDAITYYMVGNLPTEPPSEGYLAMLYEGYREHEISHRQIHDAIDLAMEHQTALAKKGQWIYG